MLNCKCDRCGETMDYRDRCEVSVRYAAYRWPFSTDSLAKCFDLCKTCCDGLIQYYMHELDEAKGGDNDA